MTDLTIIRPDPPKFGINQVIYLRESAMAGFLEPMRVYNFIYNKEIGKYFYIFKFKKSSPTTQTVGDAVDLKSARTITLPEDDLATYCEALELKKVFLEKELAQTNLKLNLCRSSDSGSSGSSGSGSSGSDNTNGTGTDVTG